MSRTDDYVIAGPGRGRHSKNHQHCQHCCHFFNHCNNKQLKQMSHFVYALRMRGQTRNNTCTLLHGTRLTDGTVPHRRLGARVCTQFRAFPPGADTVLAPNILYDEKEIINKRKITCVGDTNCFHMTQEADIAIITVPLGISTLFLSLTCSQDPHRTCWWLWHITWIMFIPQWKMTRNKIFFL